MQNEQLNRAAGGKSLRVGGGFAHFRGEGHLLNQALGLLDPLTEAEVENIERFLGSPTVLELSPAADPSLWPLLARRGYRVQQFQQLWVTALEPASRREGPPSIRPVLLNDADVFDRVVGASFAEVSDWRAFEPPFRTPLDSLASRASSRTSRASLLRAACWAWWTAWRSCRVTQCCRSSAGAGTVPMTASQRSYEACGFTVAYPKLELARDELVLTAHPGVEE